QFFCIGRGFLMTQIARPITDESSVGWDLVPGGEPATVASHIGENTPDDTTYVKSNTNPLNSSFEVRLSAVAVPETGSGVLNVRLRKTASDQVAVKFALLQGTTQIASWVVRPDQSFATYPLQLFSEQLAQITDFSNLRLSAVASGILLGFWKL